MPFKVGQTVIHETEVGGFATRRVATVASVSRGRVKLEAPANGLSGVFRVDGGQRTEASPSTANERILEVPAPPSDLWGPRSGWIQADSEPAREGRRLQHGRVGRQSAPSRGTGRGPREAASASSSLFRTSTARSVKRAFSAA